MSRVAGGITEAEIVRLEQQIESKRTQIHSALAALGQDLRDLQALIASRQSDKTRQGKLEALQEDAQVQQYVGQIRNWLSAV